MDTINSTNTISTGTTAVLPKKEQEAPRMKDTVETGGFFSNMKLLVSAGVDGGEDAYKSSDVSIMEKYRGEVIAAGVGLLGGVFTGAAIAHNSATAEVQKLPVQSVALIWKEPIMQDKTLEE